MECEKCPHWGPDEHGSHTCLTKYCIEDPLADHWAEQDELYDELEAERVAYEREMEYEAAWQDEEMRLAREDPTHPWHEGVSS